MRMLSGALSSSTLGSQLRMGWNVSGGFNESYNQYLILRGYDPSSSKLIILKRALIDSWGEPGFHQFWRVWNPGIGHLLYRLYLLLSGNRTRLIATMIVFTSCGFMYDVLVMSIFRRSFAAFTLAFVFSGILVVINCYPL